MKIFLYPKKKTETKRISKFFWSEMFCFVSIKIAWLLLLLLLPQGFILVFSITFFCRCCHDCHFFLDFFLQTMIGYEYNSCVKNLKPSSGKFENGIKIEFTATEMAE